MTTHDAGFGELRSLLHGPATHQTWRALAALLDAWPRPQLEAQILPYLWQHFEGWNAGQVRHASGTMVRRLLNREFTPALAICTSLTFGADVTSRRRLTNQVLTWLVSTPIVRELTWLDLDSMPIGDTSYAALAASPHLRSLRGLTLDVTCGRSPGLSRLGQAATCLPTLRSLSLAGLGTRDEGIAALFEGWSLTGLETLDLSGHKMTDLGIQTLVACEGLSSLRALHLNSNHITDAGALMLAQTSHLRALTLLSLNYNNIGARGYRALLNAPGLRRAEVRCNTAPS